MTVALSLAPLLLVLGLLGSGRFGALAAGGAGLAATVLAAATLGAGGPGGFGAYLSREGAVGLWLSWQVVSVVLGGLFLQRAMRAWDAAAPAPPEAPVPADARAAYRRLYFVCFLLGPFAEAVTGFGVGYVIALAALVRLGVGGLPALVLGLYSQSMVPWGALAVGSTLGAALAGVDPQAYGALCAILQGAIHVGYLALFWRYAREAGAARPSPAQRLDDVAWIALALALVWAAHRIMDLEVAGAAPLGLVAALRWLRDERPGRAALARAMRAAAPYALLTLALVATRTVPPLQAFLKQLWAVQPWPDKPAFAPLYAPAFWLLLVGLLAILAGRGSLAATLRETARGGWRPSLVTLLFVAMAALYVAAGMASAVADALHAAVGDAALFASPPFAALGGFLTGSGAASNAMLMPMQVALGREAGLDPLWVAAAQTTVTANLTMLSPIRVSMGAAILALAAGEAAIYRRAWPLALPPLFAGWLAIAFLLATRG